MLALEGLPMTMSVLDLPEALQEQWQECVAMMAVDGGVPEEEAPLLAWAQIQTPATDTRSTTPPDTVDIIGFNQS